jgi:hypothetical protein
VRIEAGQKPPRYAATDPCCELGRHGNLRANAEPPPLLALKPAASELDRRFAEGARRPRECAALDSGVTCNIERQLAVTRSPRIDRR